MGSEHGFHLGTMLKQKQGVQRMQQTQECNLSLSAVDQYMREARRIAQLTTDEETYLLSCISRGNDVKQARDRLVEGYQPLIIGLAKRFVRDCTHMQLLDFVQEGNSGLLRAIEKYNGQLMASSFKTLAFAWVRGAMLTAYWQCERAIRLPLNQVRAIQRVQTVYNRLLEQLGCEPTPAKVAREMGVKEQEVQALLALRDQQVVSLHTHVDEESDTSFEDMLEDSTAAAFADDGFFSVEDVLRLLPEQERGVFQLRFGLTGGRAHTQREVADVLGIALSTVQVLDRRARMRLREALIA
jgi:RNA polymerase primary sigma factor